MTVSELYFYAKKNGFENKPIKIEYEADDGWYSLDAEVTKENVEFSGKRVKLVF